ncbi:STAS domain-containing protein [Actinoplanes octamycinicus]|uniref:STAS domain-containing protein n=1 Tax=Actinoplanes octamycinicus TaxID=135948 RepID=UPI00194406D1|nr:STAS domain-containing protein [Actinoplanes octamycinicus]GIE58264.1 hypothetical protein Aoc01nite_36660 [Actinoplanes octamycinicus]
MSEPGGHDIPRLHLAVESTTDCCTVTLSGELDQLTAPSLVQLLDNAASGIPHLVLDVAQLSFCDLAGLRALLHAHQTASERGLALAVRNPPAHVMWLLHITGTTDHLLGDRVTIGDEIDVGTGDQPTRWPSTTDATRASLRDPDTRQVPTDNADDRDRRADDRDRRADERDRRADERDRRADERDRRADDRDLLDQERRRLMEERAHRVGEHQRWEDIREDLANIRERDLERREAADTKPPLQDGPREP